MKKILSTLTLISLLAVPMISLAAAPVAGTQDTIPPAAFEGPLDFVAKIQDIGDWIFTALLALAAIFLVVAGFFFVTSNGEPEKLNKARMMLINALIGVAVGLSAQGLIAVIKGLVK